MFQNDEGRNELKRQYFHQITKHTNFFDYMFSKLRKSAKNNIKLKKKKVFWALIIYRVESFPTHFKIAFNFYLEYILNVEKSRKSTKKIATQSCIT